MRAISIQDLKTKGSKALSNETTYLIINSKLKSAIVPIDEFNMLLDAVEDYHDRKIVEERKNEKSEPFNELYE